MSSLQILPLLLMLAVGLVVGVAAFAQQKADGKEPSDTTVAGAGPQGVVGVPDRGVVAEAGDVTEGDLHQNAS